MALATQIPPLSLASDIAHFSSDQALSADAISNPTRALSARDNIIAAKVNQLVGYANNASQPVALTVPRFTLSGLASTVVSNFRIPVGYEARVINATCWTSLPTSATLNVAFSGGTYGASAGTSLCTVTDIAEFTAGSTWQGEGELIVIVTNTGNSRVTMAGSVLISLRAVGFQGGDVVGPGGITTQGPIGPQGDTGPQGPAGPSGSSTSGNIIQIGPYARLVSYDTAQYRGAKVQVAQDGNTWQDEVAWIEVNQSGVP